MAKFMMMIAAALLLGGCCCGGGGGGSDKVVIEQKPTATPVSLGDELLKLHKARELGVLTDEEFAAAKKKLMEQE